MPACSSKHRKTFIRKFDIIILLLLFPFASGAQTLTGLWTGALSNDSNTVRKDQSFEIALTEYKGKVYGYSRSEFIVDDELYYIVKRVKGTIEGDICEVTDEEIVSYNFRGKLDKKVKVTSTFRRDRSDSTWHLVGTWKTNETRKYYSLSGKMALNEEKDLTASKIFPHLEELKLADDVAFYRERKEEPPVVRIVRPESAISVSIPRSTTIEIADKPIASPAAASAAERNKIPVRTETPVASAIIDTKSSDKEPETAKTTVDKNASIDDKKMTAANNSKTNVAPQQKIQQDMIVAASNPNAKPETKPQPQVSNNNSSIDLPANNKSVASNKPNTIPPSNSVSKPVTTNTSAASNQKINVVSEVNKPMANATGKPETVSAPINTAPKQIDVQPVVIAPIPAVTTTAAERNGAAESINDRKTEVSQVVNFKSDSLVLALYDNGQIDGDTVTLMMNGQVLMAKQGLKATAIKKTIYLKPGADDEFTMVLYAENLGTYPPNTGLLVVYDGEERYDLRFSSDFKKNTGIVFRRKK